MSTPHGAPARLVVLVSGAGTNLQALIDACGDPAYGARVVAVGADRDGIEGLARAERAGIPTFVRKVGQFTSREHWDLTMTDTVAAFEPDLVVLAGFMRVLGTAAVERYSGRLVNIHPSLLPSYPGLHTHRRVLADGATIHGCTVHFVTPEVDVGPIIAQSALTVRDDDDEASLAARVLELEHKLLPQAVEWFCAGRLAIDGPRVRFVDAPASERLAGAA